MTEFHPDYGTTDETRRAVLKLAAQVGPRAAAKLSGFGESTITLWRRRYAKEKDAQDE